MISNDPRAVRGPNRTGEQLAEVLVSKEGTFSLPATGVGSFASSKIENASFVTGCLHCCRLWSSTWRVPFRDGDRGSVVSQRTEP
jgi:hypothetical protein